MISLLRVGRAMGLARSATQQVFTPLAPLGGALQRQQFAPAFAPAGVLGLSMLNRGFASAKTIAKRKARAAANEEKKEEGVEQLLVTKKAKKAQLRGDFSDKLKRFKPITPSLRHTVLINRSHLWKGRPIKSLTKGLPKKGGRNNKGRITVENRGGGHKHNYRKIDFKRSVLDVPGVVQRIEYDPNRSAHIALIAYPAGRLCYIVAPEGLKRGDEIVASRTEEVEIKVGNAMPLARVPIGTIIHNIELKPGRGAQIVRSAGTSAQLLDKNSGKPGYALVAIASKEQRYVPLSCLATIGVVSNGVHFLQKLGKAGRNRWLGWRPHVRGVAKNPVDHPMGGGEGKSSGGRPSCSPTGVLAKGYKTRKKAKNVLVVVPRGGISQQNRKSR